MQGARSSELIIPQQRSPGRCQSCSRGKAIDEAVDFPKLRWEVLPTYLWEPIQTLGNSPKCRNRTEPLAGIRAQALNPVTGSASLQPGQAGEANASLQVLAETVPTSPGERDIDFNQEEGNCETMPGGSSSNDSDSSALDSSVENMLASSEDPDEKTTEGNEDTLESYERSTNADSDWVLQGTFPQQFVSCDTSRAKTVSLASLDTQNEVDAFFEEDVIDLGLVDSEGAGEEKQHAEYDISDMWHGVCRLHGLDSRALHEADKRVLGAKGDTDDWTDVGIRPLTGKEEREGCVCSCLVPDNAVFGKDARTEEVQRQLQGSPQGPQELQTCHEEQEPKEGTEEASEEGGRVPKKEEGETKTSAENNATLREVTNCRVELAVQRIEEQQMRRLERANLSFAESGRFEAEVLRKRLLFPPGSRK
ncbi:hypothetical protein, conserved [Eimeria tenella]|uniref:Uncharacterized protein n=1 Tax=Eimeria tenella TaxID=5802 RepID=U6KW09_EIMTE|nr:hypothetical protein, conserved [Eimeria tenella]CDJ42322.1 hypothetical protein, conserved [Eimeria tenella]|eukprot:XP_013233072.1 hypothetical protein, conserved [Eimeria tenella]